MSRCLPTIRWSYIRRTEVAAINLVWAPPPARLRSSSSPGVSLAMEDVVLAGRAPCLVVNMMGRTRLGNINPEQADYFRP
jgi:hypothetical protein